ncbi:MAG TPA: hypothetical protein VFA84_05935, partial [Acidimicrobiales bacterium]|nr:hypothetical protein [Acidimicrobiales bacterium]
ARLYIDGADPEAYRLLDLMAVRDAASNALHLKLEPSFAGATAPADLPDLESIAARWERYLSEQDLTGFNRDRIKALGDDYLARAVEEAV